MSTIIDDLEAFAEVKPLSLQEVELKNQSNAAIAGLLREEELKWYQRSKTQFILEGDSNTRYYHSLANGRHRKKRIHSLSQDEGTIEGHEHLKSYITKYYKNLFGEPEEGDFSMDETRTYDIPQVFDEENAHLTALFSEEDVKWQFSNGTQQSPRSGWLSSRVLSELLGNSQIGPVRVVRCFAFWTT